MITIFLLCILSFTYTNTYFVVLLAIKETNIKQIYRIVYDLPCNEFVTSDISYYTNANGQMWKDFLQKLLKIFQWIFRSGALPSNVFFAIAKTEEHVSNSLESKQKHPIEKSNGSLVLTNKTNVWLWHIYPKTSILTWKGQSKFIWCFRFPTDRKAIYDAVYCPKPKAKPTTTPALIPIQLFVFRGGA